MNYVTPQRIIEILQKLANELEIGELPRNEWTLEIKSALAGALSVPDRLIGAYAKPVKENVKTDWGEWLWDFVLAKHKPHAKLTEFKINMVDRLLMIAEIEWNTKHPEIAIDFQKLVFGVAALKLYIFPKNTVENNRQVLEFCQSLSETAGTREGDQYLLIGFPINPPKSELFVRAWQVRAGEIVNEPELSAG